jgi:hypothetical protein
MDYECGDPLVNARLFAASHRSLKVRVASELARQR